MSFIPFGLCLALGMLMSAVFGAVNWLLAVEEGFTWGCLALIPLVALIFTIKFWDKVWVRRCFIGGMLSLGMAIASLATFVFTVPGLAQQLRAYRDGEYAYLTEESFASSATAQRGSDHSSQEVFDYFSDGVTYATHAAELAQVAQNTAQWEQVAVYWEYAASMMAAVPSEHPRYDVARSKVEEYEQNLSYIDSRKLQQPQHMRR